MAEVFRAIEPRPAGEDRVVCLKRMLPHVAAEPGALEMFRDEATLGECIRDNNVVQMLGFGEAQGQPFLALEYVRGCDLWRLMRWVQQQSLGLPLDVCLYIVREMLRGLRAVHNAVNERGEVIGAVHRDVSPSNLLLSIHGEVKIGDLGIAQSLLKAQMPARNSGRRMGKLGYLAPEQITGAALDVRTDLFAAGVIAAELLMGGRPLFRGASELAILLAIRDANIENFEETAETLPAPLRDLVVQLLAATPDARPSSADQVLATLEAILDDLAPAQGSGPGGAYTPVRLQLGDLVAHATGEFLKVTGEFTLPPSADDVTDFFTKGNPTPTSLERDLGVAPQEHQEHQEHQDHQEHQEHQEHQQYEEYDPHLAPPPAPDPARDQVTPMRTKFLPGLEQLLPEMQPEQATVRLESLVLRDTLPPGAEELDAPAPPSSRASESSDGDDPERGFAIHASGQWRSELTYAEVVQAIAIGDLHPTDQVRLPSGETRLVHEIPEFQRHARPATLGPITRDELPGLSPAARIVASEGGIVSALGRSVLGEDTGMWLAEQGSVRKEIYVEAGTPVLVASNMAGELLGEYLVARGVVSRGELDMALAVMPRFEGKLGDTLVALGLVEPVHLFQHIAAQVEEKLLETALWKSGTFSFYPGATATGDRFPLVSSAWEIMLEATRRRIAHGLDSRDLDGPPPGLHLQLTSALPRVLATSVLPGPVSMALALLRKPMPAGALVAALDDPDNKDTDRGARVATLLMHLRVCEPVVPPPANA